MNFFRPSSSHVKTAVILLVLGQLVFAVFSPAYTAPRYEGRIYATIGVKSAAQSDLHKLNEAAHYFGQTIIGWTKFPHFLDQLKTNTALPADVGFSAHMQERQNIIFTLVASEPITQEGLGQTRDFLQGKLAEYNKSSNTGFVLSNLDHEMLDVTRSYGSGALLALLVSVGFVLVWVYGKSLF